MDKDKEAAALTEAVRQEDSSAPKIAFLRGWVEAGTGGFCPYTDAAKRGAWERGKAAHEAWHRNQRRMS